MKRIQIKQDSDTMESKKLKVMYNQTFSQAFASIIIWKEKIKFPMPIKSRYLFVATSR